MSPLHLLICVSMGKAIYLGKVPSPVMDNIDFTDEAHASAAPPDFFRKQRLREICALLIFFSK